MFTVAVAIVPKTKVFLSVPVFVSTIVVEVPLRLLK